MLPGHRSHLADRAPEARPEIEARPADADVGTILLHRREDPIDELVEPLDLGRRFGERQAMAVPALFSEQVEVAANDREGRPQVVGHDRDEVGPSPIELAQALGGPPLQRVERGLVDREGSLVREGADECHLGLGEFRLSGHVEGDGADEPIAGDERERERVGGDDRAGLGEGGAGCEERGAW